MRRTELEKIQYTNRVLKRHLDLVDAKIFFDENDRKMLEAINEK